MLTVSAGALCSTSLPDMPPDSSVAAASPKPDVKNAKPARLGSIDAYRGLVMFLMMAEVLRLPAVAKAVGGSQVWDFLAHHQSHVAWAGCSLHDLIQPSFSFLVGVSLPFSIASRTAKGESRGWMVVHAVGRAIVLVLLGVFLRSMGRPQTNWTFEDTLSQIGFGYVPLFLLGFTKQRWQWGALVAILAGYWGAFALFPLPPAGFDYQAVGVPADWPYHYSGLAAHWNKNSNLAWFCDTWFLNLFPRAKAFAYNGGGYATLSFIPTLGTMILGLIAGTWLKRDDAPAQKVARLSAMGLVLLGLGLAAHEVGLCPCVKRIWTPSWTLYSGGWCFFLLAAFYSIIDADGLASWSLPLRVVGANSIAAYLLAHGPDKFIADSLRLHLGTKWLGQIDVVYQPLVMGGLVLLVQWLILYWLYRQKVHIRI
jgi:heparan-alpha-glucosaminide N-acetyltransferase